MHFSCWKCTGEIRFSGSMVINFPRMKRTHISPQVILLKNPYLSWYKISLVFYTDAFHFVKKLSTEFFFKKHLIFSFVKHKAVFKMYNNCHMFRPYSQNIIRQHNT